MACRCVKCDDCGGTGRNQDEEYGYSCSMCNQGYVEICPDCIEKQYQEEDEV